MTSLTLIFIMQLEACFVMTKAKVWSCFDMTGTLPRPLLTEEVDQKTVPQSSSAAQLNYIARECELLPFSIHPSTQQPQIVAFFLPIPLLSTLMEDLLLSPLFVSTSEHKITRHVLVLSLLS